MNQHFVVDTDGVQHGGPHPSEVAALLAKIALIWAADDDCGDRYRILALPQLTEQRRSITHADL